MRPYMTREASEWLLERGPRAVAFDFPQDYVIRLLLKGERRPLAENVTHDVLLQNGVTLIEYLCQHRGADADRALSFAVCRSRSPAPTARRPG